ncbi:MAG: tetratricopeptide repeat protein, partial [Atribacteria sp.]|nr:tetratricopeptide repeat protein [Candidatus Atribacteria bacterium]
MMMGKYFKKERKIQPNPVNKFHSLGIYYCKTGKYIKAIECFKKVLIIDPDHLDSKNKIELLVKKLEEKENHLNGENSLETDNKKKQREATFINIPKNEKIVKKHKRLSDSEIKHYQNILQLYGKYGTIDFPKKDNHLPKSRLEDKFILRENITRDSSDKEEQDTIAYGGIHKDNNEIPSKKLRKLSNDKISSSKTIFQLYKECGTLEKVGREVGLTRERIRQILERGNRYGLFEYPIKKDLISYAFLINYFTNKEKLLSELSNCLKRDEMLQALSTDIVNFNRLLNHFNLNIKDIQIYSKKKILKMQYDEYVEKIKHHPTTTEMREDKEARNIWAKISRYWGSMESFRQEFAYPFIKQGNPRLKEDIREWQQQRSALAILRKKSYMEIILKNISDRGTLDKKYLARECDISEQDCL